MERHMISSNSLYDWHDFKQFFESKYGQKITYNLLKMSWAVRRSDKRHISKNLMFFLFTQIKRVLMRQVAI